MARNKRDIVFDTKAGRTTLCILSALLIAGGLLIIYLAIRLKVWIWLLLAAGSITCGVCNFIVCNRRKK